jgi:hypothetical protein
MRIASRNAGRLTPNVPHNTRSGGNRLFRGHVPARISDSNRSTTNAVRLSGTPAGFDRTTPGTAPAAATR